MHSCICLPTNQLINKMTIVPFSLWEIKKAPYAWSTVFLLYIQLASLAAEQESLLDLRDRRQKEFNQCMELQVFLRDTEQTHGWMGKQEVGLWHQSLSSFFHNANHFQRSVVCWWVSRQIITLLLFLSWQAFLANEDVGESLDSVEALIKKHEDFEKSLAAQEEKIKVGSFILFTRNFAGVVTHRSLISSWQTS